MTQDAAPTCKTSLTHAASTDSHVLLASAATAAATATATATATAHLFELSEHGLGWS